MSSKNVTNVFAFMLGIGAGVALGLLFAPQSGEETREDIKEKFDTIKDKVDDIYQKGKEKTAELMEKGNEVFSRGKKKANEIAENLKK